MTQNGGATNGMLSPVNGVGELHIFDFLAELWKNKLIIAVCVLVSICAALAVHCTAPKVYVATALIMPPKTDGSSSLTTRMAALNEAVPMGLPNMKSANEVYLDILKSQRASDAIIDRFSLMKRYGVLTKDDARGQLKQNSQFTLTGGQLISITFVDTDPETVAKIANAYADVLRAIDREVNVSKAASERRFLDDRIMEVEKDLHDAQEAMRVFQQKHRIIRVDDGLKATATVMAELEAERQAKEIHLHVLETVYAQNNPEIDILRAELKGFDARLKDLAANGVRDGSDGSGESQWLFPAVEEAPALALEQLELERKLKLQATLYELLTTQRELVRVNEARELSTIQVISPATPPDSSISMSLYARLLLWCAAGAAVSVGVIAVKVSLETYRARPLGARL
jgi:uncharacterized protein involved in exopolysaccharide biosynthesis